MMNINNSTLTFCKGKLNINLEMNNWINISGVHDVELIKKIGEYFNIDTLILEDIVNNNQRLKIEIRDNLIYIVLKLIIPTENDIFKHE